jgi:hypothetical protein
VDAASRLAGDRGAAAVAAALAEQALRVTPAQERESRQRRGLAAARAELAAGEWTRARTLVTDLANAAAPGRLRAEALLLLSGFEHDDLGVRVLEDARREAASDPALEAIILLRLVWAERFRKGFATALEGTRAALEIGDRLGIDDVRVDALVQLHALGELVGDPALEDYAERARQIANAAQDARMLRETSVLVCAMVAGSDSFDVTRAQLERAHRAWAERDEVFAAAVLWRLAWIELWAGRWDVCGGPRCPRARREPAVRHREEPGFHPDRVGGRPSRRPRPRS